MRRFSRWGAIAGAVLLCFTAGCGSKSEPVSYQPLKEDNAEIYHISLCQDTDNSYYSAITAGFSAALEDLFGESHIKIDSHTVSPDISAHDICQDFVDRQTQLIFANGSQSLSAAMEATTEIPIVGAGVMDFQSALHIITAPETSWNRLSETNVTGVSSTPDIARHVSLLIEATPDLQSVGILYSPEDTNAIYQNQLFEKYLDEAGIPWKEYQLTASAEDAENAEAEDALPVITPSKVVASSAREGADMDVEILGDDASAGGINAPSSARPSQISRFWTGNTEMPDSDAPTEDIVAYASLECSALYIPAGSNLADQMPLIADVATRSGVSTVAGGVSLGNHALVTSFSDPYAMGYAAGKMVYRILVNAENPGAIKINTSATENTAKLYNQTAADALGISFPKSFSEYETFLLTYEEGSTTERIASDDQDGL